MGPRSAEETPESATTHFGSRTIAEDEKASLVRAVFDSVCERYDLMNDLMSLGIHRLWKVAMIDWLAPQPGMRLLDVAGGTGDIARLFIERCQRIQGKRDAEKGKASGSRAVICDINTAMIAVGRNRALDRGLLSGLEWVCGDAEKLPLCERCVDAYTIAFGLRNVTRIDAALGEARRVLKPGGRFLCLEFSRVALPVLDRLYDIYSFHLVPALGEVVTGDGDAYRYLVESIRRFPPQEELVDQIQAVGFEQVSFRNLSGGIAALHSAWRI